MNEEKTFNITKLSYSHLSLRVDWMNVPEIYEVMDIDIPITLEGTKKWFETIQNNTSRCDFCLVDARLNVIVGMCGLTNIHVRDKRAELYIFINPEQRGRGVGKLLTKWLCSYGFLKLNLHKIYLSTLDNNEVASSLYENVGFVHEGTMRSHQFQYGNYIDKKYYGLLSKDWERLDYASLEFFNQFKYV